MIYGYHGFSNWKLHKLDNENLNDVFTFGFELEVQRGDSDYEMGYVSDKLDELFNDDETSLFVMEHDSSIGYGFEIITHPMTYGYFMENIETFKSIFKVLNDYGYRSHKGGKCGLHVHIGREGLGLSNGQISSLISNGYTQKEINELNSSRREECIININLLLEGFNEELIKFSRRTQSQLGWCQFTTLDKKEYLERKQNLISETKKLNARSYSNHHVALNLGNKKTIELRFMRGTLKWETFYLSINLIKNIVEIAKEDHRVVTFDYLVKRDLNNIEMEWAIEYLINRNIDLNNNIVVSTQFRTTNIAFSRRKINTNQMLQMLDE